MPNTIQATTPDTEPQMLPEKTPVAVPAAINNLSADSSRAPWADKIDSTLGSVLTQDLSCEVCVVGAGIGGLTTAYLLQNQGKQVCVVEAFDVGSGQTGRTTAQFSTALDDRYFELEKYHGTRGAMLAAESHRAAIDLVRKIVSKEKILCECEILDGYLFRAPETDAAILTKERDACHRAGMKDVYLARVSNNNPILKDELEVLCFPEQLQLDPILYLNGLAKAFKKAGGRLYTHSPVTEVKGGVNAKITTSLGHVISCKNVVVATNSPINDVFAVHTKQAPYRSYVIGVRVPKGSVPPALYWDTLENYHYVRMSGEELLIVGGEDHKTGQDESPVSRYENLENWVREKIPDALEVQFRWSGQVMEPVDGLGFLGHNPLDKSNVYIITGDSGNGMTHATIGAVIISDQISGRPNPWESLYSPTRKSVRAGIEFLKENANVAAQYLDWLTPKDSSDFSEMQNGTGALVRDGASIHAVYKDESGAISKCSAVCPHLGGIVHWNPAEKSWDCPCHGSRFNAFGKVIEGPSIADLAHVMPSSANIAT